MISISTQLDPTGFSCKVIHIYKIIPNSNCLTPSHMDTCFSSTFNSISNFISNSMDFGSSKLEPSLFSSKVIPIPNYKSNPNCNYICICICICKSPSKLDPSSISIMVCLALAHPLSSGSVVLPLATATFLEPTFNNNNNNNNNNNTILYLILWG
jgi:hypothetical protein